MRLFSDTAFLTVSRSSEDSSPNTMRPLQSTTRTPSLVRVASFNCIRILLSGQQYSAGTRPLPHLSHQPIACAAVLASFWRFSLEPAAPRSQSDLRRRITGRSSVSRQGSNDSLLHRVLRRPELDPRHAESAGSGQSPAKSTRGL